MVCPLCNMELSADETLAEHFQTSCRTHSPTGEPASQRLPARSSIATASASGATASTPTASGKKRKQVNVVFRWLPYRTLDDREVHLFGDKALNKGNPLPLISGSNGNYSSAQILVTAGEYVGCQLALEQGDMLPVQAFMVTDRSHIVYIFPESSLDLMPSRPTVDSLQRIPPLSSAPLTRRHIASITDSESSDEADQPIAAVAPASTRHTVMDSSANARPHGSQADESRQGPEGSSGGTRDGSSSQPLSSLYREMLLHQIGKDEGSIDRQIIQQSHATHDSSQQSRKTQATTVGSTTNKSRAVQPIRAQHGEHTVATTASRESRNLQVELFTSLGESRTRSSSLGNVRQSSVTMAANFSRPRLPPSDDHLPKVTTSTMQSATPPAVSRGEARSSASAVSALPPKVDGKHTIVIDKVQILSAEPFSGGHRAGGRPGSAPVQRRRPLASEDDEDDNEDFLWKPDDFKVSSRSVAGQRRPPAVSVPAAEPVLAVGVFAPGEANTTVASVRSTLEPGSIPFRPPAVPGSSRTLQPVAASQPVTLAARPIAVSSVVSCVTTIPTPRVQPLMQTSSINTSNDATSAEPVAAAALSSRAPATLSSLSVSSCGSHSRPGGSGETSHSDLGSADRSCAGSSGLDSEAEHASAAESFDVSRRLEYNQLSRSNSSFGSVLSSLPGVDTAERDDLSVISVTDTETSIQQQPDERDSHSADTSTASRDVAENVHTSTTAAPAVATTSVVVPVSQDSLSAVAGGRLNDITAMTTEVVTPLTTSGERAVTSSSMEQVSVSTGDIQQRYELLEQNMVRQRAHLESLLRRRDETVQQLRDRVRQIESEQADVGTLRRELQELQQAASTSEKEKKQMQADLDVVRSEGARLGKELATHIQTEALQAQQLIEVQEEVVKSRETVQAALQLEESHRQQTEELKHVQTEHARLGKQNRELVAHGRTQRDEINKLMQQAADLRQENESLAREQAAKAHLEEQIAALKAESEEKTALIGRYEADVGLIHLELQKIQETYQAREITLTRKLTESQAQLQQVLQDVAIRDNKLAEHASQMGSAPNKSAMEECARLQKENVALRGEVAHIQAESDRQVASLRQEMAELLRHSREGTAGEDPLTASVTQRMGENSVYSHVMEKNRLLEAQVQSLEDALAQAQKEKSKLSDDVSRYRSQRDHYRHKSATLLTQLHANKPADMLTESFPLQSERPATATTSYDPPRQGTQDRGRRRTPRTSPTVTLSLGSSSQTKTTISPSVVSPLKSPQTPMLATRPASDFIATGQEASLGLREEARVPPSHLPPDLQTGTSSRVSLSRRSHSETRPNSHQSDLTSPSTSAATTGGAVSRAFAVSPQDRRGRSSSLDRSLNSSGHQSTKASPVHSMPSRMLRQLADVSLNEAVMVKRANSEKHLGFVRYVGELQGAEGLYVGVELVEELGRNDGAYNGRRYFQCGPKRGVFVKYQRVEPLGSQQYTSQ